MYYLTTNHPEAVGVMCLCLDGQIKQRFGDALTAAGLSHAQAVDALVEADGALWASLVAAGDLTAWRSPALAFVGEPTGDRRQLEPGGESFRSFPQPLMLQMQTAWGHDGAVIAGRIDEAVVNGNKLTGTGVFDNGAMGLEAARLAKNEMLRGVSVDLGKIEVEFEVLEVDSDGWVTDWLDHFTKWEVMGATQTPWPAFANAKIVVPGEVEGSVQAAGPVKPNVLKFEDPEFTGPTAMDDDGEYLWGHIATWNTCHTGRQGSCVKPPRSKLDYSLFTTGYVECEDGCRIPTGVISMGGGHADRHAQAREAIAHYDSTSTAIADVAIGEDAFGIWVAGAFRSNVTDEQLREFRAASPSGDWRNIDGNLELVAVLQVNVPGFPVPRVVTASNGVPESLVAAIAPRKTASDLEPMQVGSERWQQSVDAQLRALRHQVVDALETRVRPRV